MPDTVMSQAERLRVIPLGGPFGARVEGLDRSMPADEATRATLMKAFLDHQLLVVPGPPMTPPQMRDFSAIFGEVVP